MLVLERLEVLLVVVAVNVVVLELPEVVVVLVLGVEVVLIALENQIRLTVNSAIYVCVHVRIYNHVYLHFIKF